MSVMRLPCNDHATEPDIGKFIWCIIVLWWVWVLFDSFFMFSHYNNIHTQDLCCISKNWIEILIKFWSSKSACVLVFWNEYLGLPPIVLDIEFRWLINLSMQSKLFQHLNVVGVIYDAQILRNVYLH